jgi:hypothetical protein
MAAWHLLSPQQRAVAQKAGQRAEIDDAMVDVQLFCNGSGAVYFFLVPLGVVEGERIHLIAVIQHLVEECGRIHAPGKN